MLYGPSQNLSNKSQVHDMLLLCNFDPPLTEYIEIDNYALKITTFATRYEFWDDGELIALVAVYENNPPKAYVTSVSVVQGATGKGLGIYLMRYALNNLLKKGYSEVSLEVFNHNCKALNLYKSLGFIIQKDNGDKSTMCLNLDCRKSGW